MQSGRKGRREEGKRRRIKDMQVEGKEEKKERKESEDE